MPAPPSTIASAPKHHLAPTERDRQSDHGRSSAPAHALVGHKCPLPFPKARTREAASPGWSRCLVGHAHMLFKLRTANHSQRWTGVATPRQQAACFQEYSAHSERPLFERSERKNEGPDLAGTDDSRMHWEVDLLKRVRPKPRARQGCRRYIVRAHSCGPST